MVTTQNRREVSVNLWELITTVATGRRGEDLPNGDKCRAIQDACCGVPKFCTELSLTVLPSGAWVIDLFDHEEPWTNKVTLTVQPNGHVSITRTRAVNDLTDTRTVSF